MNENKKEKRRGEQPWDKTRITKDIRKTAERPGGKMSLATPIDRLADPDHGIPRGRLLSHPEVCDASLPSNLNLPNFVRD
jgi:hypothetical protein